MADMWNKPEKRQSKPEKRQSKPEKRQSLNNFLFSRKPLLARVSELSSRARAKKQEKNKKKPKKI